MAIFIRSMLLLLAVWQPVAQAADSGWLRAAQNTHAEVRLRSATTPDNQVRLLIDVRLQPGWKTYWRTPGEGGVAPAIRWESDIAEERWSWPTPARFNVSGFTTQGYQRDVSLPVTLRASGILKGTLTLSTCSNVCILTDFPFSLDLDKPANAEFVADYARALGQVPVNSGLIDVLKAGYAGNELRVEAERADGWHHPEIFLDNPTGSVLGKPVIKIKDRQMIASMPVTDEWGGESPYLHGQELSLVIADRGISQQSNTVIGDPLAVPFTYDGLAYIALLALLGGLVLNLMPCVLPVLALKLSGLIQASGQSRRLTRQQFLASSAGIVTSFIMLALFMSLLRLSGETLGWGIQFQNSGFLLVMALVSFFFTASLFDLVHIRLPSFLNTRLAMQGGDNLSGHFMQGIFATLMATPCTAPLLGTAIGWALAAPLPGLWLLFILMGIGMSLPWLLIAMQPDLARFLPKPGRWMLYLRASLGTMLLLSCIWLLSLLAGHWNRVAVAIISLLLLAILPCSLIKQGRNRLASCVALIIALSVAGYTVTTGEGDELRWKPLTEEAVHEALQGNKRVLVDITAEWCITCKLNKLHVFDSNVVRKALKADDIVLLRGDWTHADPQISRFLQQRGSVAVPFNQVYGPATPEGIVLGTVLSRDALLSSLARAKEQP
ncbi:protein-disulfide reductase DsbD domain-containing protein [Pantoea agglomerans]|uniref:protein-disulfide reductase DsbD family protein n=1 Tax=Enterobacter agglomerans TaxID=549 RepID=UPI003C7D4424